MHPTPLRHMAPPMAPLDTSRTRITNTPIRIERVFIVTPTSTPGRDVLRPRSQHRAPAAAGAMDGARAGGSGIIGGRGAAGARWPDSSSKRAGRGPPPPGGFDSHAAPLTIASHWEVLA